MDRQKILRAYIDHVGEQEGVDFLPASDELAKWLSNADIAALYETAATLGCSDEHKAKLLAEAARLRAE